MTENLSNVRSLKKIGEVATGTPAEEIPGSTNAQVMDYIADNASFGGGGGADTHSASEYMTGNKPDALATVQPVSDEADTVAAVNEIIGEWNKLVSYLTNRGVTK